jgi:CRISPR-associated protein Csd1
MNWIEALYHTYNNCESEVGLQGKNPLVPVSHIPQYIQIEIKLNHLGEFIEAKVVEPQDASTIIPCTEDSAGRTAGIAPHGLADSLKYVAGDYYKYTTEKPKKGDTHYEKYIKQLEKWQRYDSSNQKLKLIYEYVKKGELLKDLCTQLIFPIENGIIQKKWDDSDQNVPPLYGSKSKLANPWDAFVRWSVEIPGIPETSTYWDQNLWDSWNHFYLSDKKRKSNCYITGKYVYPAKQHPRKIRHPGDGAKLISSNDKCGFTFRGRFTDPSGIEAASVSFDVTQKAHNALRWLISKQGTRLGEQAYVVAWSINNNEIPDPFKSTLQLTTENNDEEDIDALIEREQQERIASIEAINTGQGIAEILKKKLLGFRSVLGETTKILVIALDSATDGKGRIAITYYRELTASEFLDRIEKWHSTTGWLLSYKKNRSYIGAPSLYDIALIALGIPREDSKGNKKLELDDKLKSATLRRLIPCIIEARPIPDDLVTSCIQRASARLSLEDWEWQKALGIACALYRKQQLQKNNQTNYTMSLDPERTTRSYLYGRLLAVADVLEQAALSKEENRPTNAARMMQRFSTRPYDTWPTLYQRLEPYIRKLKRDKPGLLHRYDTELDAIKNLFQPSDFISDAKLDGEYLLGYHCQRSALYTKKAIEPDPEESDIESTED